MIELKDNIAGRAFLRKAKLYGLKSLIKEPGIDSINTRKRIVGARNIEEINLIAQSHNVASRVRIGGGGWY